MSKSPAVPDQQVNSIQRSIRRHLMFGTTVIFLLFGVAGSWSAVTNISGAVVAPGQLVVDTNLKKVQHPTGGVVGKLNVKDGDRVKARDILLTLDGTNVRSNLMIIKNSMDEFMIRRARLIAQITGADAFSIPEELKNRSAEASLQTIFAQESALLKARFKGIAAQKAQLAERVNQLNDEIKGAEDQVTAKTTELAIVASQSASLSKLYAQKLVPALRVEEVNKEDARLLGERGQLMSGIAQTRGKISETQLQLLQVDQDMLTEAGKDLRDIESKLAEAQERAIAAQDQLQRVDVRAPQDGVVYQLSVHTVGGVINAGETLMMIVPESDTLTVEAKISPTDVDQVFVGQKANLRFTAFNQRTTPESTGEVEFVSPDLITDQRSGASYYTVRIKLAAVAMSGFKLLPGMPVETQIQTVDRTVLSYLVKPLADQIMRAFKEG